MKKLKILTSFLLALSLVGLPLLYGEDDCLRFAQDEMNELHRVGACCEDAVFTSISASMLGWGFGLAAGIALLTGLIHNSHAESSSSSSSSSSN